MENFSWDMAAWDMRKEEEDDGEYLFPPYPLTEDERQQFNREFLPSFSSAEPPPPPSTEPPPSPPSTEPPPHPVVQASPALDDMLGPDQDTFRPDPALAYTVATDPNMIDMASVRPNVDAMDLDTPATIPTLPIQAGTITGDATRAVFTEIHDGMENSRPMSFAHMYSKLAPFNVLQTFAQGNEHIPNLYQHYAQEVPLWFLFPNWIQTFNLKTHVEWDIKIARDWIPKFVRAATMSMNAGGISKHPNPINVFLKMEKMNLAVNLNQDRHMVACMHSFCELLLIDVIPTLTKCSDILAAIRAFSDSTIKSSNSGPIVASDIAFKLLVYVHFGWFYWASCGLESFMPVEPTDHSFALLSERALYGSVGAPPTLAALERAIQSIALDRYVPSPFFHRYIDFHVWYEMFKVPDINDIIKKSVETPGVNHFWLSRTATSGQMLHIGPLPFGMGNTLQLSVMITWLAYNYIRKDPSRIPSFYPHVDMWNGVSGVAFNRFSTRYMPSAEHFSHNYEFKVIRSGQMFNELCRSLFRLDNATKFVELVKWLTNGGLKAEQFIPISLYDHIKIREEPNAITTAKATGTGTSIVFSVKKATTTTAPPVAAVEHTLREDIEALLICNPLEFSQKLINFGSMIRALSPPVYTNGQLNIANLLSKMFVHKWFVFDYLTSIVYLFDELWGKNHALPKILLLWKLFFDYTPLRSLARIVYIAIAFAMNTVPEHGSSNARACQTWFGTRYPMKRSETGRYFSHGIEISQFSVTNGTIVPLVSSDPSQCKLLYSMDYVVPMPDKSKVRVVGDSIDGLCTILYMRFYNNFRAALTAKAAAASMGTSIPALYEMDEYLDRMIGMLKNLRAEAGHGHLTEDDPTHSLAVNRLISATQPQAPHPQFKRASLTALVQEANALLALYLPEDAFTDPSPFPRFPLSSFADESLSFELLEKTIAHETTPLGFQDITPQWQTHISNCLVTLRMFKGERIKANEIFRSYYNEVCQLLWNQLCMEVASVRSQLCNRASSYYGISTTLLTSLEMLTTFEQAFKAGLAENDAAQEAHRMEEPRE